MEELNSFFISLSLISLLFVVLLIVLYQKRQHLKEKRFVFIAFWNITLSLCLLSWLITIGESYYRFYVDDTDSFSINKISDRWMKRHYQLNNFNTRDNLTYNNKIAAGKRRISIIGDSFTAGHGIKKVEDRFGNILRSENKNSELHIIAANGANSMHELGTLLSLNENGYQFDCILLMYCLNDIDYLLEETKEIYGRIAEFKNKLGFLGQESYFINSMYFKWFAFNNPDFENYSEFVKKAYNNEKWEKQKETLSKIKYVAKTLSKNFVVVTFPFLQEKKEKYSYRSVHAQLNRFWEEEQVDHIDLLETYEPYLGKDLVVNAYDAHPNEFANKLAAEAISTFLKREMAN